MSYIYNRSLIMKIGIDLHTYNDFMQGSRTYSYNVTKNLVQNYPDHEYFLYFTRKKVTLPSVFYRFNVHHKTVFPSARIFRLPFVFPIKLFMHDIDVFHCNYIAPPFMKTPYIVTLHDILHEEYPEYYPNRLKLLMSLLYPYSARKAAKVITVSHYSKNAIMRLYGIPENKVAVIYNGVADEFRPVLELEDIGRVKGIYGIPVSSKYILYVGRLEPRKNIVGLLQAYSKLKKEHKIEHILVIAGMKDFMFKEIFEQAQAWGLTGEVIFTGRVDQADLPALYSGAELFVYPSFGEGFGIPPLEAMACGVPVITSNTTSLPEVVGDAGIMINPSDNNELTQAMLALCQYKHLRDELRAKGIKRAERFSWETTASEVLKVSQEIVEALSSNHTKARC